jgi:hypothetical protein
MTPDEFDKQIRAALSVEASTDQMARLERFWFMRSRAERRRRMVRVAALAATLLVATTTWLITSRMASRTEQPATPRQEDLATATDVIESPTTDAPVAGRAPTDYERLLFAARTSQPTDPQQALLARLNRATDDGEKRQVAKLLGERGAWDAVPALLRLAEQSAVRDDALAAVERIVGVDRLAEAATQSRHAAVRAALYERLLASESEAALGGYLALVANPASRNEALAAARQAEKLPLESLLHALEVGDQSVRMSAALVLGDVDGPAVSEALIARVSQSARAPIEAWVALLGCRGAAVELFFAQAAREPRMLGQVNNARALWARMIP